MDEEIKKMLEKNLEYSQEIYKQTKYIKSYVFWAQIFGVLKILIIVVPIVIGIIYLPPLLKGVFDQYKDVLGSGDGGNPLESLLKGDAGNFDMDNVDLNNLPSQAKQLLNQ
ncbi:MAG: hypothetical protein PHF50_02085 [Patescibacteria group bacterium]|nr:hypothetical protein [Patescibacteria group bacterium]